MNLPTLVANRHTCARCRYAPKPGEARGKALCSRHGGLLTDHQAAGDCDYFPPPLPDGAPLPDPKPRAQYVPAKPVPEADWPLTVRLTAKLRVDGEVGVGDTVKRILGHLGANAVAEFLEKATGRKCGCADRARRLNELFPY